MSLFSTLYIGVSGMGSNGAGIEVAGDNIANVNTVGFKRTRANFGDVIKESLESDSADAGIGSGSALIGIVSAHNITTAGGNAFTVAGNVSTNTLLKLTPASAGQDGDTVRLTFLYR